MDTFRIKSSGESIVVIGHETINAAVFLNHHPFVREKLNCFHNLVVIQFCSCQFVGSGQFFFQSFISRNSLFPLKSQFESLAMGGFVNVLTWGEWFLLGTTSTFLGRHIVRQKFGKRLVIDVESEWQEVL